jgi:hypothetical protein
MTGAPWEVPAMYNIIEACEQLTGQASHRQVPMARRALVYGNGGIFSASSVAILGKSSIHPSESLTLFVVLIWNMCCIVWKR